MSSESFFKKATLRDRKWLDAIHDMPCVLTHNRSSEYMSVVPAHIRYGAAGGTGLKPPDNCALPLRADLHQLQHQIGEARFWRQHMTDELMMRALRALGREMYREWKDEQ